jgi:hypothetical protein
VFPDPPVVAGVHAASPAPPPEPPSLAAQALLLLPPPPPPADVIVENTELDPVVPSLEGFDPPAPPPPTVIGKAVAVTVIPVGVAKGLAV